MNSPNLTNISLNGLKPPSYRKDASFLREGLSKNSSSKQLVVHSQTTVRLGRFHDRWFCPACQGRSAETPEIRKNAGFFDVSNSWTLFFELLKLPSFTKRVDIASISLVGMTISRLAFLLLAGVGSVQSIHQHVAHFRLWFFISSNILAKEKTCIYRILCNTFGTNLLKLWGSLGARAYICGRQEVGNRRNIFTVK